jgi:hypothetical protein
MPAPSPTTKLFFNTGGFICSRSFLRPNSRQEYDLDRIKKLFFLWPAIKANKSLAMSPDSCKGDILAISSTSNP